MLRVLSVGVLLTVGISAEADELAEADAQEEQAQESARAAFESAERTEHAETRADFTASVQRAATLADSNFPVLEAALSDPETLESIGVLMEEAEALAATLRKPAAAADQLTVYVFASFSMPEASLRALVRQGELAGAPIVLRGLVEDSIEATLHRVQDLYGQQERPETGVLIDPTLFTRFAIEQVPAVVVAESAAGVCTETACPIPAHVKIAGDVPLRYALDRIGRTRPGFREALQPMMAALEPGKAW